MKRRLITFFIVSISILLIVNLSRSIYGLLNNGSMVDQHGSLLTHEKEENDRLKRKLYEVQSPEYIEKQAREKLGMSREGEYVVMLPASLSAQKKAIDEPIVTLVSLPVWKQWLSLFW